MSAAKDTWKVQPPDEVKIKWCPECGRHNRFGPFGGPSHYASGYRCPGVPIEIVYVFAGVSTRETGDNHGR